jgi:predicted transposase/invertase (TIGR01784 family)
MTKPLIRFDWAIKKLLRSKANFGILEGFLSELLKRDLKILEILESESNKEEKNLKYNRVDILVKLATQEIVLVEIQTNSETDYFYRMIFGASKIITEHLDQGEPYSNIKKVYSINILYFDLGHGSDYIYHGTTSFCGIHNHDKLDLTDKQKVLYQKEYVHELYPEYYLIKVNQFNDIAKDTLDEWIYFLKNEEIKDSFHAKGLKEAKDKLIPFKLSDQEKQIYNRYLDDLHYQASMVQSNYDLGIVDGEARGILKGKAEGRLEGEKAGIIKTAINLKNAGMTKAMIQKCTGLSTQELEEFVLKDIK